MQYHNLNQASNGIREISIVSMNGSRVDNRNNREETVLVPS